jgi:hypothetical protein
MMNIFNLGLSNDLVAKWLVGIYPQVLKCRKSGNYNEK